MNYESLKEIADAARAENWPTGMALLESRNLLLHQRLAVERAARRQLAEAVTKALPEIANASYELEQDGHALLSGLLHGHHAKLAAALDEERTP